MTKRPVTTSARVRASERVPGRRRAALALVALAPVVAEVTLGTVPLAMIWVVLIYLPIYGAGVLVIREVVRRTGGGWGSILLLGLAYGSFVMASMGDRPSQPAAVRRSRRSWPVTSLRCPVSCTPR